jgi:O-antigen ligase
MANWEYMYRLSGAPSDVVNPNGLAFIICTVLPFMYLTARLSRKGLVASLVLIPLCIYTLTLTGSRSGIVGLVIIFLGIIAKSERGVIWALPCVLLAVFSFPFLSSDLQDRYLSIIGLGEKNAETAEGRLTGLMGDIGVALHRPIFGHGLGTSREANANFAERDQPAHNLYAETAQELGFVGLILVILLLKSVYDGFRECKRVYDHQEVSIFLRRMLDAMQVLLFMNFIFSFASFGLSSYEWYLLGGFSVVMQRIAMETPGKSPASQRVKE